VDDWTIQRLDKSHDKTSYLKYGFVSLVDDLRHLILPMQAIRRLKLPLIHQGILPEARKYSLAVSLTPPEAHRPIQTTIANETKTILVSKGFTMGPSFPT
jgi:hypothetical protein